MARSHIGDEAHGLEEDRGGKAFPGEQKLARAMMSNVIERCRM